MQAHGVRTHDLEEVSVMGVLDEVTQDLVDAEVNDNGGAVADVAKSLPDLSKGGGHGDGGHYAHRSQLWGPR